VGNFNVSPYAYELFKIGNLPITNSFLMSIGVSLIIALGVRLAVGKPSLRPNKAQSTLESVIESLQNMLRPIVGERMLKPTFPLLISFFLFILLYNWSGLLPGVGTVGAVDMHEGEQHLTYFLRPGNTDLTMALALALISFGAWVYYVVRYAGVKNFLHELFANKANPKEVPLALFWLMSLIFAMVGCIEIISILIRPVSLSFRLFGNMFGGENLLMNMTGIFLWIIPVPIYFLEILIGLVQAFVFTLLTAVYIGLVCNHGGENHEAHASTDTANSPSNSHSSSHHPSH
jgi:F-type H+-transporting ATPase subunit a